ncbi:MAG: 50S ribosomal protein L32 [Candidatus Omnitrophica bacterium CG1_02_49_10]|nr:MAG: 50S ribosomal protein L32 [Candidatus Omnitrophica bacterium CG1_02_49_10]
MPLPKRRHSRTRGKKRRGQDSIAKPSLSLCPNCKKHKPMHSLCPSCGYYKGRAVFIKKDREKKKKTG